MYLVPVGPISADLYASYVQLLQQNRILPISSLTRPGGYATELSPFKSFSWNSSGKMRFRFVSTTERIESCDGEDVHAWNRPIGAIGICHCPSTPSLQDAYAQFTQSIKHFPGTLVQKCFAFEHQFEVGTVEEVASLSNLVMFPVHHELDEGCSTVSLHLQVVMDTIAVTILMSLESTIRAAMRQQAQSHSLSFQSAFEFGEMASFLLDTNVEPSQSQLNQQHTSSMPLLSPPPQPQSLHATISSMASTAVSSTASAFTSPFSDSRSRKRQLARQRKLFGDYSVLLNCVPDALEHYVSALDLLKEEERKSSGASGDVLWLAAALEGYVYCLFLESRDQFVVEIVEKASEAITLYAKAGVSDLECQLIEKIGWYYVAVASQIAQAKTKGKEKVSEGIWVRRLLWDALERGLTLFPDLQMQRQIEFMIEASRMLECVGHRRRMALFLHEAVALLIGRNSNRSSGASATTPAVSGSNQRKKDLQAALLLERITAARLGITDNPSSVHTSNNSDKAWEVTTLYRSKNKKTRRGIPLDAPSSGAFHEEAWLILRFHVLRQLLTISKMLGDPFLVGKHCIQLLRMLPWCDSIASHSLVPPKRTSSVRKPAGRGTRVLSVDQVQRPFSTQRGSSADRAGLYPKSSVYFTPPSSVETKTKRYFSLAGSPSATMSSAAASLSSTIASTPRILATPRQQFSAAVSAISTKASPAFASFSHNHGHSPHSMSSNHSSSSPSVSGMVVGSPGYGSSDSGFPTGEHGSDRSQASDSGNGNNSAHGVNRGSLHDRYLDALPVWNIRSKEEIVKMEKSILNIMEAECSSLRPSEQVKLSAFLGIEKLRVMSKSENPFLTKATALEQYAQTGETQAKLQQSAASNSDFFYSPFEKQQQQRTGGGGDADGGSDPGNSMYEKIFPVYEKIEVEMIVSNPFGVAIDIQQVTAWVIFADDAAADDRATLSSSNSAVECYPSSVVLSPYEKHKSIILGIQPLKEGTFHVRGCFLKVLSLKTSFALDIPLELRVVGKLPLASLSLCEFGSLTVSESENSKTAKEQNENLRICMFSSETKQCELRVRNVGQSVINRCRIAVTVLKRQVVRKTVVLFNNLGIPSPEDGNGSDGEGSERIVIDTESITLRCRLTGDGNPASTIPMQNGDIVSIPFEILLQKSGNHRYTSEDEPLEEEEQVVWSVVYADDPPVVASSNPGNSEESAKPVFYRETKLALDLVSLPSLTLSGVSLLPSSPESIPTPRPMDESDDDDDDQGQYAGTSSAILDNSHSLVVVEVVNPTETTFRFRMRHLQGDDKQSDLGTSTCDVEIGRKCSRRLALELPRVRPHNADHGTANKLADLLNSLVEMEWETYFGTKGKLFFEDYLWSKRDEDEAARLELLAPELSFEISTPALLPSSSLESASSEECGMGNKQRVSEKDASFSRSPFTFFQGAHLTGNRRQVQARAFEYVPLRFQIRKLFDFADNERQSDQLRATCEVWITQEDDMGDPTSIDEHVVVVGMLQTAFEWPSEISDDVERESADVRNHDIQVLFLSHGVFRVTICGRVQRSGSGEIREVWCHQPLYIQSTD